MKALSLTPWWAWIVAEGLKPIENRTWNTSFRGEFLIHASKGKAAHRREVCEFLGRAPTALRVYLEQRDDNLPGNEVERGGIVAVAELIDVILPGGYSWLRGYPSARAAHLRHEHADSPWYMGSYGYVLRNIRRTPFVPCRGSLGFWEAPTEVEQRAMGRERALRALASGQVERAG